MEVYQIDYLNFPFIEAPNYSIISRNCPVRLKLHDIFYGFAGNHVPEKEGHLFVVPENEDTTHQLHLDGMEDWMIEEKFSTDHTTTSPFIYHIFTAHHSERERGGMFPTISESKDFIFWGFF